MKITIYFVIICVMILIVSPTEFSTTAKSQARLRKFAMAEDLLQDYKKFAERVGSFKSK